MNNDVIIIGAGGLGRVMHDFLEFNKYNIAAFLDDADKYSGEEVCGKPVLKIEDLYKFKSEFTKVVLAVLDPKDRENLLKRMTVNRFQLLAFYANSAFISPYSSMGSGCTVLDYSYIMNNAKVDKYVHVHFNGVIGHDATVGAYTTFGPSCIVGGFAKIGKGVKIGMGVKILPGVEIGDYAVLGANSLVTKNIPPASLAYGSPARVLSIK